jgi:hypothetical protein
MVVNAWARHTSGHCTLESWLRKSSDAGESTPLIFWNGFPADANDVYTIIFLTARCNSVWLLPKFVA